MIKLIQKVLSYFEREIIIRKQKKQLDHYLRKNYQITLDGIPLSMVNKPLKVSKKLTSKVTLSDGTKVSLTDKKKEKGSLSCTW